MSYHRSMLPLGALGWPMDEMASYGLLDSDAILPNKPLCGSASNVQRALKEQGFYGGPIDGQLGSGSVTAIKNFSIAKGIGSKTWPDATFCSELRRQQNLLLVAEFERRNPPAPEQGQGGGGDIVSPVQGGSTQTAAPGGGYVAPAQPAAPAEDNTTTYVVVGVAGLLVIGTMIYLASS